MITPRGILLRKVFTHPPLKTYEWVPYEDYDVIIGNLDEFEKLLKIKRDASKAKFDPISQEAIGIIENLSPLIDIHLLPYWYQK